MIIAGGCYRELCEAPAWDALYGSGGRAAAALARLAPRVELHTYRPPAKRADLYELEVLGIEVHAAPSKSEIAIAYFHPLSQPHISPGRSELEPEVEIRVQGSMVLRFGFLEGDAIVNADRAVYDPQTAIGGAPFGANGSTAGSLAVVMNVRELLVATDQHDVELAAKRIMTRDGADVVIAKSGIQGARLFERSGSARWIPAFHSPRVFKIGTGDIFSASFAYYWGVERLEPHLSAELASRSVASYCGSRSLPLPARANLPDFTPVGGNSLSVVTVVGSVRTLAGRWLLEEARWQLVALGIEVRDIRVPGLEPQDGFGRRGAVLVLADGFSEGGASVVAAAQRSNLPVVVYGEEIEGSTFPANVEVTDDFTTALYWAGWASATC